MLSLPPKQWSVSGSRYTITNSLKTGLIGSLPLGMSESEKSALCIRHSPGHVKRKVSWIAEQEGGVDPCALHDDEG
jgi:hypothetical protein